MKFQSTKHQTEIECNENDVEYCEEKQTVYCIGKDLVGNHYKIFLGENNQVEDVVAIHLVRDC